MYTALIVGVIITLLVARPPQRAREFDDLTNQINNANDRFHLGMTC